jgi:transposase InsO family protein
MRLVTEPDSLLHHSDSGSQYTSEQFQRLMSHNGVVCSMSANVWDKSATALRSFAFSSSSCFRRRISVGSRPSYFRLPLK